MEKDCHGWSSSSHLGPEIDVEEETLWLARQSEKIKKPVLHIGLSTQMYRTDFWTLWEKARVG